MLERPLQLQSAAADVLQVRAQQPNRGISAHRRARLVDALLIDEHASGENQRLRPLPRGGVPLIDEQFVQTNLFNLRLDLMPCDWVIYL